MGGESGGERSWEKGGESRREWGGENGGLLSVISVISV